MKPTNWKLALGLLACGFAWDCGSPGPPLPPSLELAQPVNDLHAVRKGDKVALRWSVPVETTDKQNIRHPGPTQVCRSLTPASLSCNPPIATISASARPFTKKTTSKIETSYVDQLSPNLERDHPTAILRYAVRVLNSYGKTAGLSNEVPVPAAPTLEPPGGLDLKLERDGVRITWNPVIPPTIADLNFVYRVYRREDNAGPAQVVGELPVSGQRQAAIMDRHFEWEKTYQYRVTVVSVVETRGAAEQEVEGEDSEAKQIPTHDVFRPATPTGVQAVFSAVRPKQFVDLVWTPNTDADLAGYNVYRREQDKPLVKINRELLHSPAFRDSDIELGKRYFYSVSAVNVRGNESSRSEEASETTSPPL